MDDLNDDEILAEAIADVAFDVFSRIGNDPDARYAFFKRLVVTSPQFSVAIWNWSKGPRILSIWRVRQIEGGYGGGT
jgi:hypothetical protein